MRQPSGKTSQVTEASTPQTMSASASPQTIRGVRLGKGGVPNDPVAEASVALQQLGYKPAEITRMLKEGAAGDSAEDIIRKALKSMLRNG